MKTLNVSIPILIESETGEIELIEQIKDEIVQYENDFIERSALICQLYDMRDDYCDGSLVIEDIQLKDIIFTENGDLIETHGVAFVTYEWYAHYGCKDMCNEDQIDEEWPFHIINETINFNLPLPEQRNDEL